MTSRGECVAKRSLGRDYGRKGSFPECVSFFGSEERRCCAKKADFTELAISSMVNFLEENSRYEINL